jgi:shikimate kinase/3-dehydroquinate synthase
MKRSLLLNGLMATGKSTVGRALADRVGVPFVDLDASVESRAGCTIREIFQREGEAGFRQLEREELERILEEDTIRVVALGGGALLRRSARLQAISRAVVVSLTATPATIMARTHSDGLRPLLVRSEEAIADLIAQRSVAYAEAHARVIVDGRGVDDIVDEVERLWRLDPVAVAAGEASYSVEVGVDFAKDRLATKLGGASSVVVMTDDTVGPLYASEYESVIAHAGVKVGRVSWPAGEEHKNPETLQRIWLECLRLGSDRKSRFVGLGGGVVTDVAGFAAATWMRGVPWVSMPTTLLGMVDASVGGKTAVDLPGAKNCVGAFWQPSSVLCDIGHLRTEGKRGYVSALAEVVKTALIGDAEMFRLLQQETSRVVAQDWELACELVRRCIVVKASVVSRDEREGGLRASLNLGHTVGHAIEACGGFGGLTHGESVSLGLVAAMRIGRELGHCPEDLGREVVSLLEAVGLPTDLGQQPMEKAAKLLAHDKKRGGTSVRFVFCPEPGRIVFEKLALARLQQLTSALG